MVKGFFEVNPTKVSQLFIIYNIIKFKGFKKSLGDKFKSKIKIKDLR